MLQNDHLHEALQPKIAFVEFGAFLSKNPLLQGNLAFGVLGTASGIIVPRYPDLSLFENTIILLSLYIVFVMAVRYWFPAWIHWGMTRNIPLVIIYCAFWFTGVLVSDVLGYMFQWDDHFRFDRFFLNCLITLPLCYVVIYFVAQDAKKQLGKIRELVPIWWPTEAQPDPEVVALKNANLIRRDGRVVIVETSDGPHMMKSSLAEVLERVDVAMGMQVHRSYWVAYEFIERIMYVDGNPRLICDDQQVIPISRNAAKQLKRFL